MNKETTYKEIIEKSKVDIPKDIENIAFEKIRLYEKNKRLNSLKFWITTFSTAAIVVILFTIIKPENSNKLYSQNLSNNEKKEQFENALKIINESLSGEKPKEKVLYDDENFKIVLGK